MSEVLFSFFILYLAGSIPFGVLLSKALGHGDLREAGSGNIGATNALRVGGKRLGILTLVCDMLKAAVPILFLCNTGASDSVMAFAGLAAVVGHIFPIWLKFRGGKGVATALAVLLVLVPYSAIVFIVCWFTVFLTYRIVSLASVVAVSAAAILSFWAPMPYFIMSLLISAIVVYKHTENIKNIIAGVEYKFKS